MLPAAPPTSRPFDVVGFGATSVDFVYQLPSCPAPTASLAKLRINRHFVSCGGQVATALAACARLGLRSKFVGVIGSDNNGARLRSELEARRIDLTDAIVRDAPNQYAVILVDDQSGERIVLWDRDDRLRLRDHELRPEAIAAARVLHVDDVDADGSIRAATLARAAGTVVTTDIDRVNDRTMDLANAATVPIFAEHVPSAITGVTDPAGALRAMRARHDGVLCVTLGARGALALDGDHVIEIAAFAVEAVDTTGAGDVFRGAFIYGYLNGWPLEHILRFANAAAAVSCTRPGALASVPSPEEAARLMR
jgi:sulfofructose kinase